MQKQPLEQREPEGWTPNASVEAITAFIESTVWSDMVDYLHHELTRARDELETDEQVNVAKQQSKCESIRHFLVLPNILIGMKLPEEEPKETEDE